jgi:DNA polymerase I-like protein with 3'-5' exonuclease and polymerase domains
MSVLDFLSTPHDSRTAPTWIAQEPPDLSHAKDIIVNFETTGLKWQRGDAPVGVTVGTLDGQIKRYLPFGHQGGGNLDKTSVVRYLQSLRNKHITNAHTSFDLHMARVLGVDFESQGCTVSDIQHTAALLDDHRRRFALDILATDYLGGIEVPRIDETNMQQYAAADVAPRAEYQAQLIAELHAVMYPLLQAQDLMRVQHLEDSVIYPVVEMEKNGALLDMELNEQYHNECITQHNRLLWEVSREVGFAFDTTPKSWRRVFEKYQLPVELLDEETGSETYADGVLSRINHPIVQKGRLASQYKSLDAKTFSAYPKNVVDSVLYFELNQLRGEKGGTVSGRFSAGYIQQAPNHDNHFAVFGENLFPRRVFIAANGMRYFAADAAQIEYRIFASHANNPSVIAAYQKDPWLSFHKFMWAKFKEYKPDMLYSHQKNLNFMTIYGGGLIKTAVMMGFITEKEGEQIKRDGTQFSDPRLAVAREIQDIYNKQMPEVGPLLRRASHSAMRQCNDHCRETMLKDTKRGNECRELHRKFLHKGFVRTITGRRARFISDYGLHAAFNRIVQGTGADILKTKIVEVYNERKRLGLTLRMTVHDEITGDVPNDETAKEIAAILNHQSFPKLRVPILWETATGNTWADCK